MKIILFLLFVSLTFAQNNNHIIASVGNETINDIDFKSRYELMPHLSENKEPDSLKKEFLYSLIAEKLWALEAINHGYDTSGYFISSFEPLKKMYLKDALFQEEIGSRIKITSEEVATGIFRSNIRLQLYIFPFTDSISAQKLYSILNKSKLDSILTTYKMSKDNITTISYGDMDDPALETILYKLKPGEHTPPVSSKNNWFVFYLNDRITNIPVNNDDLNKKVKAHLKELKSRELGMTYLKKLFSRVKSEVNKKLFEQLAGLIETEIAKRVPDDYEKKQGVIYLNESSVVNIMNNLRDNLTSPLFTYNDTHNVTINEFLYALKFEPLKISKKTKTEISSLLKKRIDNYIEQDLLSAEAIRRGLDKNESVLKELSDWKESYVCQMLRNEYLRNMVVSDDDVYQYYLSRVNKIDTVAQVNIQEILTDKLEIIELILNELNKGTAFGDLARLYTKREWTKEKGGEFGFFPVTRFKELGSIAIGMKKGDVFGPIKTEEGYSIIKLLDKKDAVRSFTQSFDKVKDELRNELKALKLKDEYDNETVRLSYKYHVSVNRGHLSELKLNDIPMFTYRYMGFGGRIAAVPYTTPWYDWVSKNNIIF